jgi:DNA modification methylase
VAKTIHPFPARMAPELALHGLSGLKHGDIVLDPMAGSGTVCRQASENGLRAIGLDMDPLAVLMTRTWTSRQADDVSRAFIAEVLTEARTLSDDVRLDWIDGDAETEAFTRFWFADRQRCHLRKISSVLHHYREQNLTGNDAAALDIASLALSRIIVTKDNGASLARDVSHSRPHKVSEASKFDVWRGFELAAGSITKRLQTEPPKGGVDVFRGDARSMTDIGDETIDAVFTSPPYLNAIDYLRGHRLALVWLGHSLAELRSIRSESIGAERRPDRSDDAEEFLRIRAAIGNTEQLPSRFSNMIDRYVQDLRRLLGEVARVLKPHAQTTFVIGNSCLRGVYIDNAGAVMQAGEESGLVVQSRVVRDLPEASRYLPLTSDQLGKRMRQEVILAFRKPRLN